MKRVKKITKDVIKYFLFSVAALVVVITASTTAVFYFYPKDKVLSIITTESEKILLRKVLIRDIHYGIRGISLSDCSILNSMNQNDSVLVSAGSIDLRISILALAKRRIEIKSIAISNLELNLFYEKKAWVIDGLINDIRKNTGDSQSEIKTTIDYIQLENAHVSIKSSPESIRNLLGDYTITSRVQVKNDSIALSDYSIKMPESRGFLEGKELLISLLNAHFEVTGSIQLIDCSLDWLYKWGEIDFLPYSVVTGSVSKLKVTGEDLSGYFSGTTSIKGKPSVSAAGSFAARFFPVSLRLTDLSVKISSSKASLKFVNVPSTGSPSFSVSSIDANIEEIAPLIPFFPSELFGKLSGKIAVEGRNISSDLSIRNLRFGKNPVIISDVNTDVEIKGNTFKIENLPVRLMGHNAIISAASPENFFKEVVVNIKIGEFDPDKAFPPEDQKNTEPVKATSPQIEIPLHIRGMVDIGKIKQKDITLTHTSFFYDASGKSVNIPKYSTSFLDSVINGSAMIDLSSRSPYCDIKFNLVDLKIQRLSEVRQDLTGRIFGNAKARGNLRFNPFQQNIEDSLQGKCDFQISNGKIANTGIQDQLGIFLDPLKYKLKDLEFNTISGSIAISGKSYQFNPLVFNSPDIRLLAEGSVMNRDALDAKMTLEFDNIFIQDLTNPAAMLALNRYRKGKWYTRHFAVKGNISDSKYDVQDMDQ